MGVGSQSWHLLPAVTRALWGSAEAATAAGGPGLRAGPTPPRRSAAAWLWLQPSLGAVGGQHTQPEACWAWLPIASCVCLPFNWSCLRVTCLPHGSRRHPSSECRPREILPPGAVAARSWLCCLSPPEARPQVRGESPSVHLPGGDPGSGRIKTCPTDTWKPPPHVPGPQASVSHCPQEQDCSEQLNYPTSNHEAEPGFRTNPGSWKEVEQLAAQT